MLRTFTIYLLVFSAHFAVCAQKQEGKVIIDSLYSAHLENSKGESPKRALSIYLPPGYDEENKKYPVIYYLHGFLNNHVITKTMKEVLDYAINEKRIRPFILVISDQRTTYDGSFYSNSELYGNWEDFTVEDLVTYMDANYKTLASATSRGITGHSMGGYGALKLAMKHPEVFGSVYALSPGALTVVGEYGPNSTTYYELEKINSIEELKKSYFPKVIIAFAKSWSPNPNNPPFYCDIPYELENGKYIGRPDILDKWYENMPVHMIDKYFDNLKKLRAIKLDWGRNSGERFTQQCKMFSQRLENLGITHFAEEYIGTHTSGIFTKDGRVPNDMLPFFENYLTFD